MLPKYNINYKPKLLKVYNFYSINRTNKIIKHIKQIKYKRKRCVNLGGKQMPKVIINPMIEEETNGEIFKGIAKAGKTISETVNPYSIGEELDLNGSEFKACTTNLPEKTGFWTKVKNVLFYEIKVELTPYQQKIEDEINEFLHQEVTFKTVKDFLFQEITFGKKK